MNTENLAAMFDHVDGGATPWRLAALAATIQNLTPDEVSRLRVVQCADEKTGRRYGDAACRRGFAKKLGGGGRNRNSLISSYQVWAVWN